MSTSCYSGTHVPPAIPGGAGFGVADDWKNSPAAAPAAAAAAPAAVSSRPETHEEESDEEEEEEEEIASTSNNGAMVRALLCFYIYIPVHAE